MSVTAASPRSNAASPAFSAGSNKGGEMTQSRQSGRVTFPNSVKSPDKVSVHSDEFTSRGNPFTMPPENDIFMLRDKERQRKKQERIRQRDMKVHQKTTYATRINFKTTTMIHPADSDTEMEPHDVETDKAVAVKDDPQFTLAVTRDRNVEKESLADYISKKREMFLVQYSLGVKRDEMRKLEEIAAAEERKLELAEQYLEEDAAMFDEFLKENDKNSVEAIKIAETETKAKLEKVAEIKRINAQMMAIKSEISKYEELLKEYQQYKQFLDKLTPKEWREEEDKKRQVKLEERQKEREKQRLIKQGPEIKKSGANKSANALPSVDRATTPAGSEKSSSTSAGGRASKRAVSKSGHQPRTDSRRSGATSQQHNQQNQSVPQADLQSDEDVEDVEEEELKLFFADPQQLLDIFAELEEQNLSLIQNSQETEEALEEMKQTIKETEKKMEKETEILKEQIDKLNTAIKKEEDKGLELELKAKMFSFGEFKAEDQEKMLSALNKKVEDVYRSCIGDNEANISTLQMLTNIENRMEELFEQIEMMPQDKVEAAEKTKEKERRLKAREEKMEQQRLHQEERVRRALERAKADPKKKTGKKLVTRSEPPRLKKKDDGSAERANREEEELAYFFT